MALLKPDFAATSAIVLCRSASTSFARSIRRRRRLSM
jgi:hypothetical protein